MTTGSRDSHLDAELVFDRVLSRDESLDLIQDMLVRRAPRWASGLRIWRGPTDQRPIDARSPGSLRAAVQAACREVGDTYRNLVEKEGTPPHDRSVGSVELRGDEPALVVVVSLDDLVSSPLGTRTHLGNAVALQVRAPRVGEWAGEEWLAGAFEEACATCTPAWARAGTPPEYRSQVMSATPARPVGRDFGRYLPGLFWLNYFGRRYSDLIGHQRLLSAPEVDVKATSDGVLLRVSDVPWDWASQAVADRAARVMAHLGTEYFFDRNQPGRSTLAPEWPRWDR